MLSFGAPGAGGLTSVESPIRFAVRTTRSSTYISILRSSLPSRRLRLQNGHVLINTLAPVALASFMRSLATASARSGRPALTPPPAPQQRCSLRFLSISTSLMPGMLLRTFLAPQTRLHVFRDGRGHDRPQSCSTSCLLYTSDAADDLLCVDLGGRRIIK